MHVLYVILLCVECSTCTDKIDVHCWITFNASEYNFFLLRILMSGNTGCSKGINTEKMPWLFKYSTQ